MRVMLHFYGQKMLCVQLCGVRYTKTGSEAFELCSAINLSSKNKNALNGV